MKILLVEDDDTLLPLLTQKLAAQHYIVDVVQDGEMGWSYGSTFAYDLIVADVMLPKLDGMSLCKRFRAEGYTTPILLLLASDATLAKVQGFDAGADDCMAKPLDWAELGARMRALLRRGSPNPLPLLSWGQLLLNPTTCEVSYDGQPLTLTRKEYKLLDLLLRDSQHVFSTEEILDRLWASEAFPSEATVRSHVRRVRRKLQEVGAPSDFIATLHGRGYYLNPGADTGADMGADMDEGMIGMGAIAPPTLSASPGAEVLPTPVTVPPFGDTPDSPDYLDFLRDTWHTTRPQSLEHVWVLAEMARSWEMDSPGLAPTTASATLPTATFPPPPFPSPTFPGAPLLAYDPAHAQQIAHQLAETLSLFGFVEAAHLARRCERTLESAPTPPAPAQVAVLLPLLTDLRHAIETAIDIDPAHLPGHQAPLVLMIGPTLPGMLPILPLIEQLGLQGAIAPTPERAIAWLTPDTRPIDQTTAPVLLIVQLPPQPQASPWLPIIQTFVETLPTLPVLVIAAQNTLPTRLDAIRQGSHLFLPATAPPAHFIRAIQSALEPHHAPAKIMVVDGDLDWLYTLPILLKPWGFKITTLDNPHQFWEVLQAIDPDLLILEAALPDITGFDLCQILRSDPHWQKLPILFLSVLSDRNSQNRAFALGADDYLSKPIMGLDLATRILNRLTRIQHWAP